MIEEFWIWKIPYLQEEKQANELCRKTILMTLALSLNPAPYLVAKLCKDFSLTFCGREEWVSMCKKEKHLLFIKSSNRKLLIIWFQTKTNLARPFFSLFETWKDRLWHLAQDSSRNSISDKLKPHTFLNIL